MGVSGGADSVALLRLLTEAGFRDLIVCHLDHQLRGDASAGDARFVRELAEELGLVFEGGREDLGRRMEEGGASMETAAREARHAFFASSAEKYECDDVLLGHHADDQAETVLWNLLRGSHGLKGMRVEQEITLGPDVVLRLHRPLLDVRHADLTEWLSARGYAWREDASNKEPVAVRNRLRNEVFPLLDEISGRDSVAAFVRAAGDAAERRDADFAVLREIELLDPQGRMHLPTLRKLAPDLQRAALRQFLMDHDVPSIDRSLLERAVEMMDTANPAAVNLPGGRILRRREGRLLVCAG